MDALGMVELNSIARGIETGDAMLKIAQVSLVAARPVCPGKYIVTVQGTVSAVASSVEAGRLAAGESLVDSFIIPNLHPQVFSALVCASEVQRVNAIGIVETFSLASCVQCADVSVKAADVDLIEIRLGSGLGGKSYYVLTGDVSAAEHAVRAATESFREEGVIAMSTVIPSPHEDMIRALL